ncbi:uncharacterized protein G2W53_003808 [Senna tora]|uniref:Uncharacterized protein n=1 Tax=Senna tora TaxID=362788 RepID=A0A834XAS2_9FABA|nr:uncharacterized protein G2W53_003808 [Senna tora]
MEIAMFSKGIKKYKLLHKEPNRSLRVVFGNPTRFNARMGLVIAWKVCEVILKHILNGKSRLNLKRIEEVQVKHVAQVSQTDRFAFNLGI